MIPQEYLKDNFLTAYFIDQERKNIEIQTTTEDKKKVFTTIIPFEEGTITEDKKNKFIVERCLNEVSPH